MDLSLPGEKELLLLIAKGDQNAFRQLFIMWYDKLYSTALVYVKVHQHAEDIVQQVFLKIWEKRENLAEIDRIDNYLFIIARNEALNFFNKEGRSQRHMKFIRELFKDEADTPEDQLSLKQKTEIIEKAIAALPPQQKEAWRLSRTFGLPQEEIAKRMGIALPTVKGHISKALQAIRSSLKSHLDILLIIFLIIS